LIYQDLNVSFYPTMKSALSDCCDSIFAIISIEESYSGSCNFLREVLSGEKVLSNEYNVESMAPSLTIRMNPAYIPDTRDYT